MWAWIGGAYRRSFLSRSRRKRPWRRRWVASTNGALNVVSYMTKMVRRWKFDFTGGMGEGTKIVSTFVGATLFGLGDGDVYWLSPCSTQPVRLGLPRLQNQRSAI